MSKKNKVCVAEISLANQIKNHDLVRACSINNTADGGFRTPDGLVPGLHELIQRVYGFKCSVIRLGRSPRRGKSKTRRGGPSVQMLSGLRVHSQMRRWVCERTVPSDGRARALVQRLNRLEWRAVASEVPIYLSRVGGTAIDLLCESLDKKRVIVVEIKTVEQLNSHHKVTYHRTNQRVPVSEYVRHQTQLAATVHFLSATLQVPLESIRAFVAVVTWDAEVNMYPLTLSPATVGTRLQASCRT